MTSFESKCSTCGAEYPYSKTLSISTSGYDDGTYEANLELFIDDNESIRFVAATAIPRQAGRHTVLKPRPAGTSPPLSFRAAALARPPSALRSTVVSTPHFPPRPGVEIHAYMDTNTFEMLSPDKARAIASAWNDIAYVGDLLVNSYPNFPQELQPFLL